jgi:hypothetical protein
MQCTCVCATAVVHLTESAENTVCESVSNGEFPLSCNHEPESCGEEEVGYVDICDRNASPFH